MHRSLGLNASSVDVVKVSRDQDEGEEDAQQRGLNRKLFPLCQRLERDDEERDRNTEGSESSLLSGFVSLFKHPFVSHLVFNLLTLL